MCFLLLLAVPDKVEMTVEAQKRSLFVKWKCSCKKNLEYGRVKDVIISWVEETEHGNNQMLKFCIYRAFDIGVEAGDI